MDEFDSLINPEWAEWVQLTPAERFEASERLWPLYLALGGSLDPEPDPESPFYDPEAAGSGSADGRSGVHIVRRGPV
jgi:hypothetical protein